jgi:hypothetical protein
VIPFCYSLAHCSLCAVMKDGGAVFGIAIAEALKANVTTTTIK